jgi:PPM family protein phosphatase
MVCSDGLTAQVAHDAVQRTLAEADSLDAAAEALVEQANRAGGTDNVTVLLARVGRGRVQPTLIPAPPTAAPKPARPPRVLERVRRRRRRGPIVAGVLVVLALGAGAAVYAASRTYFIEGDAAGQIEVRHGFPFQIGGLAFSTAWQDIGVPADAVRRADAEALDRAPHGQGETVARAAQLVWRYGLPPAPAVRAAAARTRRSR